MLLAVVLSLASASPLAAAPTYTTKARVGKASILVVVKTKKKLRRDQKLRVYFAPPEGEGCVSWGPIRDVRPKRGRPTRIRLKGEGPWCKGYGYVGIDLLRDGFPSRNVLTRQVRVR